ncbi:MAG: adenosylmethionine decarboxylase [Rhodocyclaceae bacterium]|nr:adenosylmethionine decarboxylase [Rhodocyclaceae bacterium]
MRGLHIFADFYNCPVGKHMACAKALRQLCIGASETAGLTVLGDHFYQFSGVDETQAGGATGALVLAESHLAVHTWPERGGATLDVYVCNVTGDNSSKAEALYAALLRAFGPADVMVERVFRGKDLPVASDAVELAAA